MQRSGRHAQKKKRENWRMYGRWGFALTIFIATALVATKLTIFLSAIFERPLPVTHATNYQASQHFWTVSLLLIWVLVEVVLLIFALYDKEA